MWTEGNDPHAVQDPLETLWGVALRPDSELAREAKLYLLHKVTLLLSLSSVSLSSHSLYDSLSLSSSHSLSILLVRLFSIYFCWRLFSPVCVFL